MRARRAGWNSSAGPGRHLGRRHARCLGCGDFRTGCQTRLLGRARRTSFFPHNWLRGYVDFSVAPPHNEPDLGRCSQSGAVIAAAGGANSNCNAYARYLLGGYLEIQPFGKTIARHLFIFFTPTFSFGNNVPQFKYTGSMSGIAFERAVGVGFELPKNFEIRITQHQVDWLGKYNHNVGLADLGTSGPYGLYSTIGARWYFGGYGRIHEGR